MSAAVQEELSVELQEKVARRRAKAAANEIPPITINPERMGGTPLIGIQRISVATLFDYLIEGDSVDEFLDSFPGTDRDKVIEILEMVKEKLEEGWLAVRVDY